ncbi:hypothetical protein OB13_07170, partial [Pontibacter sp. HJ8]
MKRIFLTGLTAAFLFSCSSPNSVSDNSSATAETTTSTAVATPDPQQEAQAFLETYTKRFQELYTKSAEAEWRSNTHIVEGDTTNAAATRQ